MNLQIRILGNDQTGQCRLIVQVLLVGFKKDKDISMGAYAFTVPGDRNDSAYDRLRQMITTRLSVIDTELNQSKSVDIIEEERKIRQKMNYIARRSKTKVIRMTL